MGIWKNLTGRLIDTHCHLHHYENSAEIISDVKKQGIRVHLVTVHPAEYNKCLKLTQGCENINVSLGMFPLYIDKYESEMEVFWDNLPDVKFVGEVGLDFTVEGELRLKQVKLFKEIVDQCNDLGGKVLSIHSRRSAPEGVPPLRASGHNHHHRLNLDAVA